MATLTSAQHVFMFLWIIGSVAAGVLKAEPGVDVTLQCNSPKGANVSKLVWSRCDLEDDANVFFFRDNRSDESYQDPRYRDRVELKDPEMKNGDASVVLKSVTVNDTGTYQCRVTTPNKQKDLLHSVHLSVSERPLTSGSGPGLYIVLGLVCPLVVLVVVGFALGRFVFPKPKSGPL